MLHNNIFFAAYYIAYLPCMVFLTWGLAIGKEKLLAKSIGFRIAYLIAEFASVIIIPFLGILTTQEKCSEHPLDLNNMLTPYACWAFSALGYYASRYLKNVLPPLAIFLSSGLVAFGFFYCLMLSIHFSKYLIGFFLPGVGAEIMSPFIGVLLMTIELLSYKKFYSAYLEKNREHLKGGISSFFASVLAADFFKRNSAIAGLLLPFVVLLQGFLFLMGQAPDSLVLQFTESCGFLLSARQQCNCGDHYLCSVAAFGNKKLVKPIRNGVRGGKIILVNRQLLVANAFENWFEDHSPRLHKIMRRTYDAMNIPADKWARKKSVANFFYIVMKPAEWLFLGWLYLLDKNPETRIAKQYLPKSTNQLTNQL